jgi:hypothetical protein
VLNNDCILSINIYTFLSMDANPNFPKDYTFFPPDKLPSQAITPTSSTSTIPVSNGEIG